MEGNEQHQFTTRRRDEYLKTHIGVDGEAGAPLSFRSALRYTNAELVVFWDETWGYRGICFQHPRSLPRVALLSFTSNSFLDPAPGFRRVRVSMLDREG